MKDFYWKKNREKWDEELTPLGEGMIDFKNFKKFIMLLKENNMHGPFYLHCEYRPD